MTTACPACGHDMDLHIENGCLTCDCMALEGGRAVSDRLGEVRKWAEDVISHDIGYDADAGYYSAALAVLRILDGKDPCGDENTDG